MTGSTRTRLRTRWQRHGLWTAALSIALLAAAGCTEPVPERSKSAAPPPPEDAAPPPIIQKDEDDRYFYTPIGKRDPFRPFFIDFSTGGREEEEEKVPRGPLERYDISQLKLVGIISGISNPRAMLTAPDGKGYVIRRGTPIGKNGGRATMITRDSLIIEEEYIDGNGRQVINRIDVPIRTEEEGEL